MVHDRQYILAKRKFLVNDYWDSISMPNSYVLSYSTKLHVSHNDDMSILLLGDVWQTDTNRPAPHIIITKWNKETALEEIFEQEDTWCGHYLIITHDNIITDATASMSVFYSDNALSGSLSLLQTIENKSITTPHPTSHNTSPIWFEKFRYPQGINEEVMKNPAIVDYFPGPTTFYKNIRRLLPSEIYNYADKKTSIRPLLVHTYDISNEERLNIFSSLFLTSLREISKYYYDSKLLLAISGGRDSRTCLAALTKSLIGYDLFTIYNSNANMHSAYGYADYRIAQKLSRRVRKKLKVIKQNNSFFNDKYYKDFLIHTHGLTVTQISSQFPSGMYDVFKNPTIFLRNQIWELISGCYDKSNTLNSPESLIAEFSHKGKIFEDAARNYLAYIHNDALNNLHLTFGDRVYWELRCGSWMADNIQAFDMIENVTVVQVLNCRRFIELLIGMDKHYRQSRQYELDLIARWSHQIKDIQYDDTYNDCYMKMNNLKGKIKRKILKIKNKLLYAR